MPGRLTHKNLTEVDDSAPKFGYEENQEARLRTRDLEASTPGSASSG